MKNTIKTTHFKNTNTRFAFVYHSGQASTLIAIVFFAAIALLAIFGVIIRYSWDPLVAFVKRRRHSGNQHHARAFFNTQLGAYIAALILCNAFSSISFVINAEWADKRVLIDGTLCNTQAILAQIGDTGGAYFTGTIAIHTFNTLVMRNKPRVWICLLTVILGWLVAIFTAAAPTFIHARGLGPVYGFNGVSCGISNRWPVVNTVLRVVPLLLGSVVSVPFFTLVFLVLRGTLIIKNGIRLNFNRTHRWSMSSVTTIEYQRYIAAVARSMLWYPFAYNILLLPEIVVSLARSSGYAVPFEASVFAATIASMLGIANALILINTLRILRPFLEGNLTVGNSNNGEQKDTDMESFFAGAKSPTFTQSPNTPKNPDKAFGDKRDSDNKGVWTPPPRSTSKPTTSVGQTVARSINRVSRAVSLKPKGLGSKPSVRFAPEIARSITPVAELNAMITIPEPARRKFMLPSSPRLVGASPGLPAPRRDTRSPLIRRPTNAAPDSPGETQFTSISLNTPKPTKTTSVAAPLPSPLEAESRHTSANDSILSIYFSRSPEQADMVKPAPPPKPGPVKSRPQPMPLSARPSMTQASIAPSPLPTLRSARVPAPTAMYTPDKNAFASNEWKERTRRAAPAATTTTKAERRRSRSLDLSTVTPAPQRTPAPGSARTLIYGDSLTASTPRRDPSLSAVAARTPTSARRQAVSPGRAGSVRTPGAYGYI